MRNLCRGSELVLHFCTPAVLVPDQYSLMGLLRRVPNNFALCLIFTISLLPSRLLADEKKDALQYGEGLIVNVPYPEADVEKAVDEVVQNGKIRGTKEYNKDEFVGGANAVDNSSSFPAWTEGGKVFYKERLHALDPRNFKESNDVGTLAVRYVVMRQDEKHTVVRIDAIFVEEFRHRTHASDGSVENAEYKEIHDRLDAMQLMKDQTAEAERKKQEASEKKFEQGPQQSSIAAVEPANALDARQTPETVISESSSVDELKKRVRELRQQTQRRVKGTGASLRSAPFHTAATLEALNAGAEVLIVISTPYWYGVETHSGQHGWVLRDDLEELP